MIEHTIVASTHDRLTPVARSYEIAERLPGAKLHILEGRGHCSPMEAPDEINALIRQMALQHTIDAA